MSASAGKVMPRPMGDYNALTEYKVLDIVTYNDRPYMAKQTTQGNLPTNTTYWMLLLDFPTEVDNVPTQNSQNLVKSGGVYSATADKMKVDGSNATNVNIGDGSITNFITVNSITKDAGENESLILTKTYSDTSLMKRDETLMKAHIGNDKLYYFTDEPIYFVIDSVSSSSSTLTITAHLKVDDSAAINISSSSTINGVNYVDGNTYYNHLNGAGCGTTASNTKLSGRLASATANHATAEGDGCAVFGANGHAEGKDTAAGISAHAEGSATLASGNFSHAEGRNTIAAYETQHVMGFYNDNKSGNALEIGDGSASTRHNCFEVDYGGFISQNNGVDKYKFAKSGGIDGFYDGSNNFHPFYKELVNNSVVLSTSADTTVTFSDASITADSTIEPFTSVYTIAPKDCVATAGSCTVTIPKQSTAQTIMVKIRVS